MVHNRRVGIGRKAVASLGVKAFNGPPQANPSGLIGFLKRQISQILALHRPAYQAFMPRHEQVQTFLTSLLSPLKQSGLGRYPEARFLF